MRLYSVIFLVVLVLDQVSKFWIVSTFALYEGRAVIPGFFNLVYVTNKGAAFSMLASIESPIRHYFFVIVNSAAAIGLTIAALKMKEIGKRYPLSLALIAGGAVGNLVDRIRFGAVIDFLDFFFGNYHWPAFNVADSAICIGVTILFIARLVDGNANNESN
ncbi:MAG: signal peptidase II [Desulfobacterales bacterium]|nr:MAG: signal peptidase II [Desulfobacterales bacterium]